jgi:hypothetical protein
MKSTLMKRFEAIDRCEHMALDADGSPFDSFR